MSEWLFWLLCRYLEETVPIMRFLAFMATAELMASGSEGFMPVTAAL